MFTYILSRKEKSRRTVNHAAGFFYSCAEEKLFLHRDASRAGAGASAAADAGIRINHKLTVAFGNRRNGAFRRASAAADASVSNLKCHGCFTSTL